MTEVEVIETPLNPWLLSTEEYDCLPTMEQERLRQRVIVEAMPVITQSLVIDGNYWLLLAGTWNCARRVAANASEIPPAEEIDEFSRRLGCVAYGVYRSEITDEYK